MTILGLVVDIISAESARMFEPKAIYTSFTTKYADELAVFISLLKQVTRYAIHGPLVQHATGELSMKSVQVH